MRRIKSDVILQIIADELLVRVHGIRNMRLEKNSWKKKPDIEIFQYAPNVNTLKVIFVAAIPIFPLNIKGYKIKCFLNNSKKKIPRRKLNVLNLIIFKNRRCT